MKNILLITNYKPNAGGISGQVQLLNQYLNKETGFAATIFNTRGSIVYRLLAFFKLFKVGKTYDVFHIHGCSHRGFFPIVLGVLVGKLLHKRIIITYHGGDADRFFEKHPRLVRSFLLKSDVNIILSEFSAHIFSKYDIPYTIIPNALELKEGQFVKRDTIKPHFISVRALNEEYNVECIIKAFQLVVSQLPEANLTVLGDGTCRQKLELLVEEQQISHITFVGRINNSEIYNYLSKSDIFVSSPVIDNQPVSILEAYNAGLLVISSRVGGVPYMLDERITGLLFESDNYKELAQKMKEAVENQTETKLMIDNAHNSLGDYSWGKIKNKLLRFY